MLLETLVALVVLANVTVPVVPDPDYLQQLYQTPNKGPLTEQSNQGTASPMDIGTIVNLALTAGLGYFFQKNRTTMDRRTYMAADTTVKLAQNDQASDAQILNLVYAMTCMADIMGKHYKEDMETYQTRDGVSLWTYIEFLNKSFDQSFTSRYINQGPVDTTGTQSKDRVVATFNKVQAQITPTAPSSTLMQSTVTGRVQSNKTANEVAAGEKKG